MKYLRHYESLSDYLTVADGPSEMPPPTRKSRTAGEGFTGTASYEEASLLAINGVPEIEGKIRAKIDEVGIRGSAVTHSCYWDTAGQSVDVDRYLNGDPECMLNYEQTEKPGGKILSLTVNISCTGHIGATEMLRRGAAVCCIVDALEDAGYRLEITAVDVTTGIGHRFETRIDLKSSSEPLDLSRVAYCLSHPSMLRRHSFSFMECQSAEVRGRFGIGAGYGGAGEPEDRSADIYIGNNEWDYFQSDSAAQKWLDAQIARFAESED